MKSPLPTAPNSPFTPESLPPDSDCSGAEALARTAGEGPLQVVITGSPGDARRLRRELQFFTSGRVPVLALPSYETLPYESFSPPADVISDRLHTLATLADSQRGLLVLPISSLMQRLAPPSYIHLAGLALETGQALVRERFQEDLLQTGYHRVDSVHEAGEFAVRGSLIDIFPLGSEQPFRVDLLGDQIDSIRNFDPQTQKSIDRIEQINVLPAREYPLTSEHIKHFREAFITEFSVDERDCPLFLDITQGLPSPGAEYYLPLFFEHTTTLFDYLPDTARLFYTTDIKSEAQAFHQRVKQRFEQLQGDRTRPLLEPQSIYLEPSELTAALASLAPTPLTGSAQPLPPVGLETTPGLADFLADWSGQVLFCAESPGRREIMQEALGRLNLRPEPLRNWEELFTTGARVGITIAPLDRGRLWPSRNIALITEADIHGFEKVQRQRQQRRSIPARQNIQSLAELSLGDPVVHLEHGVGRYRGLSSNDYGDQRTEFLGIEYQDGAILYVPVSDLSLVGRYAGSSGVRPPLAKLGSSQWKKNRRKVARKLQTLAVKLLDTSARRSARPGQACKIHRADYNAFVAGFPFDETPDQATAIVEVLEDMQKPTPMDRLVCGDVGFGKTEVAMRAAFAAAQDGRQVCILVPTTLLAHQHTETFRDRFAGWPVRIEMLSRFRTDTQWRRIEDEVEDGRIDILIGTHALVARPLNFKNLGLLVIDEEHRFGVAQKEHIKALKSGVDVLTLTATPIPRTLNMALSNFKDMSIIATPPERRLPIKTFVRQWDAEVIREAIDRELLRGGQVFFLHNEVRSIEQASEHVRELVPGARIAIAHGQMSKHRLEKVMSDFHHHRFNVLVCSTIVESGLDIPNANTIIIKGADKLGLAQLHQLRGRVGRSHHQAYAYLLHPERREMTEDANRRLHSIADTDSLGAGLQLALDDLDIRGAGELLGREQSGQIEGLGYGLYMEILQRTLDTMRRGESPNLDQPLEGSVAVDLGETALIPDNYLPDINQRLILYRRISAAPDLAALTELQAEMIDRFGLLPVEVKNLLQANELRQLCQRLGVEEVRLDDKGGKVRFADKARVDPLKLAQVVQEQPKAYRIVRGREVRVKIPLTNLRERLDYARGLLDKIAA